METIVRRNKVQLKSVSNSVKFQKSAETPANKKWARYADNCYECSTRGDKRFSALYARLKDGRTIEETYQLDIKGYRSLGYSAMQAKMDRGVHCPRKMSEEQRWEEYLALWKQWAKENPELIEELRIKSKGKVLTDMFASSPISQARALATILSE